MSRIILFSPNPIIGGTEVIFARLGERASARSWDVHVVDQAGGAFVPLVRARRGEPGQSLGSRPITGRGAVIVTTPKYLGALCEVQGRLPPDSRVLLYQVHPYEWISALYPGFFRIATAFGERAAIAWMRLQSAVQPGHRRAAAHLLRELGRLGALASMDGPCRDATLRHLGQPDGKGDEPSMPVVALPTEARADERPVRPGGSRLAAAYFGRVSDFKTATVVRIIEDLAATPLAAAIDLHVIGDGDGIPAARAAAAAVAGSGLRVTFHGSMPLARAQAFLGGEADVVFAMGSSALDAAILGIPVYLANPLQRADRRAAVFGGWLPDQTDASLGAYDTTRYSRRPLSIADAVAELPRSPGIGPACRAHVLAVHDAVRNADHLLDLAVASSVNLERYVAMVAAARGPSVLRRRALQPLEVVAWPRSS